MKIEHSKLSEDELRKYAILATEVRRKFRSSAEAAKINCGEGALYLAEVVEEAPQLARRYLKKTKTDSLERTVVWA